MQIPEKASFKMIFRPEHAEDISYVYVVNQIFEVVSDLFAKQISKRIGPYLYGIAFMCISSRSVDTKFAHCCFSIDEMNNKKVYRA